MVFFAAFPKPKHCMFTMTSINFWEIKWVCFKFDNFIAILYVWKISYLWKIQKIIGIKKYNLLFFQLSVATLITISAFQNYIAIFPILGPHDSKIIVTRVCRCNMFRNYILSLVEWLCFCGIHYCCCNKWQLFCHSSHSD